MPFKGFNSWQNYYSRKIRRNPRKYLAFSLFPEKVLGSGLHLYLTHFIPLVFQKHHDVFKGYRKRPVAWNGLNRLCFNGVSKISMTDILKNISLENIGKRKYMKKKLDKTKLSVHVIQCYSEKSPFYISKVELLHSHLRDYTILENSHFHS